MIQIKYCSNEWLKQLLVEFVLNYIPSTNCLLPFNCRRVFLPADGTVTSQTIQGIASICFEASDQVCLFHFCFPYIEARFKKLEKRWGGQTGSWRVGSFKQSCLSLLSATGTVGRMWTETEIIYSWGHFLPWGAFNHRYMGCYCRAWLRFYPT